jgi:DNA mismatch repair protein MutS2
MCEASYLRFNKKEIPPSFLKVQLLLLPYFYTYFKCQMVTYPKDALTLFEFTRVVERLASLCRSEVGVEKSKNLTPGSSLKDLKMDQKRANEMYQIVAHNMPMPGMDHPPIKRIIHWLGIVGYMLDPGHFRSIVSLIETMQSTRKFFKTNQDIFPALWALYPEGSSWDAIIHMIDEVVDTDSSIKSSASERLAQNRNQLAIGKNNARTIFERMVRKYKRKGWLLDFEESHYNNRRVLAVEAEFKRKIQGLIHGSSESGKSVFIEPFEVVEVNNEVASLEQEEKTEIRKILLQLTADVSSFIGDIRVCVEVLGMLDFNRAKVRLAQTYQGIIPKLSDAREINLVRAFHPILLWNAGDNTGKIIPLDLSLGEEKHVLVISGPNAGGKSIALKTLGILQLMVQSGLFVPVHEDSVFCMVDQLFVDIGDDQSIEYELSTYSSRLVKMNHFLKMSDASTLVLIDEFGTGSDPELGGALAESILKGLVAKNPLGVITTHYHGIKVLAEQHSGIQNGAMLFDPKTLKPLYRLEQGQPGSSFTFEVAQKMGLPQSIIQEANELVSKESRSMDRLLTQLQARKVELNQRNKDLRIQRKKMQDAEQLARQTTEDHLKLQKQMTSPEIKKRLAHGQKFEQLMEFWNKKKTKRELTKRLILAIEKESAEKSSSIQQKSKPRESIEKKSKVKFPNPKIGDQVRLEGGKQTGILDAIDKKKGTGVVFFGSMKTIVNLERLTTVVPKKKKEPQQASQKIKEQKAKENAENEK